MPAGNVPVTAIRSFASAFVISIVALPIESSSSLIEIVSAVMAIGASPSVKIFSNSVLVSTTVPSSKNAVSKLPLFTKPPDWPSL